jgi:membrane-associated phospholipid phosphatase
MVFFSIIGDRGVLWLVLAVAGLLFTDRKPEAWRLALTMLCIYFVVDVALKVSFGRLRPYDVLTGLQVLINRPTSSSFPSTHAALGIAGALAGTRVFPSAGWILWPLGILVGVSRLYVGVHWPSDVAGGMLAGAAIAWFVIGGRTAPQRRLT